MADEVTIPFGDNTADTAVLLLAAADKLDLDPAVVRTTEGAFVVPKQVADDAGVGYETDDEPEPSTSEKSAKEK